MIVVIVSLKLWTMMIACRARNAMRVQKMGMDQPAMLVIVSDACVNVLEGREKERDQQSHAGFDGRDTTHSVIDCTHPARD